MSETLEALTALFKVYSGSSMFLRKVGTFVQGYGINNQNGSIVFVSL